ncbi:MAG: helix-turn-helix domain-containing protein [Ruminococcus sp.]|nr:helix-turn-helix domain-containing protein [Ruminococcus sp.]
MEVGNQIKKHRTQNGWSQEVLAEKAFVSRQTVSNWENGKSYPDIHSLVLLGNIFNISLDELIKGDVEVMKKEINTDEIKNFSTWSWIMTILSLLMIFSPIPLLEWGVKGIVIWAVIVVLDLLCCFKVEKLKKKHNLQTYKEISAFMAGKPLDEIVAERKKISTMQKIMFGVVSGIIGVAVSAGIMFLLNK